MRVSIAQVDFPARIAAGALCVGALGLAPYTAQLAPHNATAVQFFLLILISAGQLLFVKGLGQRAGAGFGALVGCAVAISLAGTAEASGARLAAFVLVATGLLGVLGYLAGDSAMWTHATPPPPHLSERVSPRSCDSPAEELVQQLALTITAWRAQSAVRPASATEPWQLIDAFLRRALRDVLGAQGVFLYRTPTVGAELTPLASSAVRGAPPLISEERVRDLLELPVDVPAIDWPQRPLPDGQPILIHLRHGTRAGVVVALTGLGAAAAAQPAALSGCAILLQMLWSDWQLRHGGPLARATAQASATLTREELLPQMEALYSAALERREPFVTLVVVVEGLRWLDDNARWAERDRVLRCVEATLLQRMRADDLLGRFSEDHFVVVLQRLDSALGTIIAEKLFEAITQNLRREWILADGVSEDVQRRIALRAGLAGFTPTHTLNEAPLGQEPQPGPGSNAGVVRPRGGADVLERAIGLVDFARSQRIDLATDIMTGLPTLTSGFREGGPAPDEEIVP